MKHKRTYRVVLIVATVLAALLSGDGGTVYARTGKQLQNVPNERCLDSNTAQKAYMRRCNDGNFQRWEILPNKNDNTVTLRNVSTRFCLDSNTRKRVYTHRCNGGAFQRWYYHALPGGRGTYKNLATGFCLASGFFGSNVNTANCKASDQRQVWNVMGV